MIIKLSPQRRDDTLIAVRSGNVLILNGESFDFSRIGDGDTLPNSALSSQWFVGDVERIDGELVFTLLLPNPWNYSPEQAFPSDLVDVAEGLVPLPLPLPLLDADSNLSEANPLIFPEQVGIIDWSQLVTRAMKDAVAVSAHLVVVKAELAARNAAAVIQIARIQDRIDTIGYGIDSGDATEEDEKEQTVLMTSVAAWKTYKFALGKVTKQSTWPAAPVWPVEPLAPVIEASPEALAAGTM